MMRDSLRRQLASGALLLSLTPAAFAAADGAPASAVTETASSSVVSSAPAIGEALAAQTHPAPAALNNGTTGVTTGAVGIGTGVPAVGMGGIFQGLFGLVVVIGLVFACGWVARRLGIKPQGARRGGVVNVVGSASLGTRERVVVVEVAGSWLVLGVAPGSVRRLHTVAAPDTPAGSDAVASVNPSFQAAFAQQLRAKFTKSDKA